MPICGTIRVPGVHEGRMCFWRFDVRCDKGVLEETEARVLGSKRQEDVCDCMNETSGALAMCEGALGGAKRMPIS